MQGERIVKAACPEMLRFGRFKSVYEPSDTGAYPSFCSMKRLGVFLLSPGWDASPSQGYPQR